MSRLPKKYKSAVTSVAVFILICLAAGKIAIGQETDYRAQSLYIYKFTRYITWPENKRSGTFNIGVYGNSPVYNELELMASIKKAGNDQDIAVKEITPDDILSGFNIIYLASSKSREINIINDSIVGAAVLVVAERPGLANRGAAISFLVLDNGLLKFEVNISTLSSQNLMISEELLKLGYKTRQ
jgi:hypothetical protein